MTYWKLKFFIDPSANNGLLLNEISSNDNEKGKLAQQSSSPRKSIERMWDEIMDVENLEFETLWRIARKKIEK